MVTYVQNKLIKVTTIVEISILRFNAHCMRPTRQPSAVYSTFALETRCAFVTNLRRFYTIRIVRRLCVTGKNLGQRKHNEFRACALLVPNVRLALVWRSSGVYIYKWKNAHIFSMQKMCAEVDAHKKWMTFIRRSRQIINEFWRTPSEWQRTDQNSSFFVRWTCVMVCVTGLIVQRAPRYSNKC